MLAYHNDPAIKAKYVARFAAHRAADQVIQGEGFDPATSRGCFVGCTLDDYDHSRFPAELGWPEWLARLPEEIFEGLPKAEAPQFGTDLLDAVKPGVDLERVRYAVALGCHRRALARLADNAEPYADQCRKAIQGVIDWINDGAHPRSAASAESAAWSAVASAWSANSAARDRTGRFRMPAARSAAWAASASAAWSTDSAVWSVADSAAWSVDSAVWSAADSAARSATRSATRSALAAARSAEYTHMRNDLLIAIRAL